MFTFNIIKERIEQYIIELNLNEIDKNYFFDKIYSGWCDDISHFALITYISELAASMITIHPQYAKLSSIILIKYLHEITMDTFSEKIIYIHKNRKRPQDVFMRVAIQLHKSNWPLVKETYDLMSNQYFSHATPTLYNSCCARSQLASCFLLSPKEDSIEGLYETLSKCALISKFSGGIGINLHDIRGRGSALKTTGGKSLGIIPFIQVINSTMKYINQGGFKRSSSIAIYLEPWHKDIFDFIDLRKNSGQEDMRARDVFTALWINDIFMERVEKNEDWSLFCPDEAHGLSNVWGEDFNKLYLKYEKTKNRIVVKARKLWKAIIEAQIETGTPYMIYKDSCNRLSNQQNLGTIKSSNLCGEIIEFCDKGEIAVCNLASICLSKFIINTYKDKKNILKFDFDKLRKIVKILTKNLNNCIDNTFYPVPECKTSNLKHRPIGIGVQGLADLFVKLRLPFESSEARTLNYKIFENIYFAALDASSELAKELGPYESYQGSPLSKGIFHFELCKHTPENMTEWEILRKKILKYGVRNSLMVAPMPTASTSQIFNNNECFEPFTSNIYTRRTHAGEFQIVNQYLVEDLLKLNLWNHEMKNLIIQYEGSIQNIPVIPDDIKKLYKTAWEMKMKNIIDLAADRQYFIDQSQSLNLFVPQPTYSQLSSMHFYGYKRGLKTGMYYLRTKPISSAIKFTVDQKLLEKTISSMVDDTCDVCSA